MLLFHTGVNSFSSTLYWNCKGVVFPEHELEFMRL